MLGMKREIEPRPNLTLQIYICGPALLYYAPQNLCLCRMRLPNQWLSNPHMSTPVTCCLRCDSTLPTPFSQARKRCEGSWRVWRGAGGESPQDRNEIRHEDRQAVERQERESLRLHHEGSGSSQDPGPPQHRAPSGACVFLPHKHSIRYDGWRIWIAANCRVDVSVLCREYYPWRVQLLLLLLLLLLMCTTCCILQVSVIPAPPPLSVNRTTRILHAASPSRAVLTTAGGLHVRLPPFHGHGLDHGGKFGRGLPLRWRAHSCDHHQADRPRITISARPTHCGMYTLGFSGDKSGIRKTSFMVRTPPTLALPAIRPCSKQDLSCFSFRISELNGGKNMFVFCDCLRASCASIMSSKKIETCTSEDTSCAGSGYF